MFLERLLPENVRHLAPVEEVFSDGPRHIRRWTLLGAGAAATARLLLGYGRSIRVGADGFGLHPDQRFRRCAGLFESESRVTDPVAFLKRLHHKSKYRAGRARMVLDRLKDGLSDWLGWDVGQSLARGEIEVQWQSTPRSRQVPAMVALDIARHAFDAAARLGETDPLRQPGVVLFERAEAWCPAGKQAAFFRLLDGWFPNLQFILALDGSTRRRFPRSLLQQRLPIPEPQPRRTLAAPRRLPRGAVLLVDLDSRLPNLALMKLSRHFKAQGRVVDLCRGIKSLPPAETVLASCVFHTPVSARRVEVLQRHYGKALQLGGSGVDLRLRLEPDIEALAPGVLLLIILPCCTRESWSCAGCSIK